MKANEQLFCHRAGDLSEKGLRRIFHFFAPFAPDQPHCKAYGSHGDYQKAVKEDLTHHVSVVITVLFTKYKHKYLTLISRDIPFYGIVLGMSN